MTAPKYTPGEVIRDPITVVSLILQGAPIYFNGKVQNPGFLQNWRVSLIAWHARCGRFAWARMKVDFKER